MKRIIFALAALLLSTGLFAQNDNADNIVGIYSCGVGKDAYKVSITKQDDGTFKGQICWMAETRDSNGKVKLDTKNPDKSLRNTPLEKVVIFSGLTYDAKNKVWNNAKIYDPDRGIRVKMTAKFEAARKLVVRGTVLGIGESVTWTKD